jgi:hypothetical protein
MALDGVEFLHRFWLHILPPGLRRIRHYGIFSTCHKTKSLTLARVSLAVTPGTLPPKKPCAERVCDLLEKQLGRPLTDCLDCCAVDSLTRILPSGRAPPPRQS